MVNLKLGDFGAELAGLDECEVEDQILRVFVDPLSIKKDTTISTGIHIYSLGV